MKIHPKLKALDCSQHLFHYKSIEIFRHSRAATSLDPGQILPNFEPIDAFIAVLVTCKNEKDRIKNKRVIVITTLYIYFSNAQGQLTR